MSRTTRNLPSLLREGFDALLSGDVESGKTMLRDYIKAPVGFEKLGAATGAPPRASFGCSGRAAIRKRKSFSVIGYLQKHAGGALACWGVRS